MCEITNFLSKILSKSKIHDLAKTHKFVIRERKIVAFDFLATALFMCDKNFSYSSIANRILATSGVRMSKQAISKKIQQMDSLVKELILKALPKVLKSSQEKPPLIEGISKVVVCDSTVETLNDKFEYKFPGYKKLGCKAGLKLHVCYDLSEGVVMDYNRTSANIHDADFSKQVLANAQPGWLIVRDLGYYNLSDFFQMQNMGVYFLTRIPMHVNLVRIDDYIMSIDTLIAELKKQKITKLYIDRPAQFYLHNTKKKIDVRLIICRLNRKQYRERLSKAIRSRSKNNQPALTEVNKERLRWNLMFTNLEDTISAFDIFKIYKSRWQIEILFKAIKSFGGFEQIKKLTSNPKAVESIFSMKLLYALICLQVRSYHQSKKNSEISLLKWFKHIAEITVEITIKIIEGKFSQVAIMLERVMYLALQKSNKNRKTTREDLLSILRKTPNQRRWNTRLEPNSPFINHAMSEV